jgi:hypothetical protein
MLVAAHFRNEEGDGNDYFRLLGVVMRRATRAEAAEKVDVAAVTAAAGLGHHSSSDSHSNSDSHSDSDSHSNSDSGGDGQCWMVQWEEFEPEEAWDEKLLEWMALPVVSR